MYISYIYIYNPLTPLFVIYTRHVYLPNFFIRYLRKRSFVILPSITKINFIYISIPINIINLLYFDVVNDFINLSATISSVEI